MRFFRWRLHYISAKNKRSENDSSKTMEHGHLAGREFSDTGIDLEVNGQGSVYVLILTGSRARVS